MVGANSNHGRTAVAAAMQLAETKDALVSKARLDTFTIK